MATKDKRENKHSRLSKILLNSINECLALFDLFISEMENVFKRYDKDFKQLDSFFATIEKEGENRKIPISKIKKYQEYSENVQQDEKMIQMCPKFTISHLIQIYDIFYTSFISEILFDYRGLSGLCDNPLTLEYHKEAKNLEDIKRNYIKIKLEELMRDTHGKQIEWIDKKLKTKIKEEFPLFNTFILVTEVRNIIVHNDGIINNIFKSKLKKYGIDISTYKLNTKFELNPKKMAQFFECIISLIIYLYVALCSKLFAKENELFMVINNDIVYKFLSEGKYRYVQLITDCILNGKLKIPNGIKDILSINLAIAYKKSNIETYITIVNNINSEGEDVKLAKAILLGDYDNAVKIFNSLKPDDMLYRGSFEWPLFDDFRKSKVFKEAFKEKFNQDFDEMYEIDEPIEEHKMDKERPDDIIKEIA